MNHRTYIRITDKFQLLAIPTGFLSPLFIIIIFDVRSLWASISGFVVGLVIIIPLWRYLGRFKKMPILCPECNRQTAVWNESRHDVYLVCGHCGEVDRIDGFNMY